MSKRGKKKTHLFTKPLFEENFRLEMEKQLHEFKENHELDGKQINDFTKFIQKFDFNFIFQ